MKSPSMLNREGGWSHMCETLQAEVWFWLSILQCAFLRWQAWCDWGSPSLHLTYKKSANPQEFELLWVQTAWLWKPSVRGTDASMPEWMHRGWLANEVEWTPFGIFLEFLFLRSSLNLPTTLEEGCFLPILPSPIIFCLDRLNTRNLGVWSWGQAWLLSASLPCLPAETQNHFPRATATNHYKMPVLKVRNP